MKDLFQQGKIKPPPTTSRQKKPPYTKLYGLYHCHHCQRTFWKLRSDQKCCSIECRDHIRSQNKCKKVQIPYFNKNEGKIVVLQSTWELYVAEWLDQHKIVWIRPSKRIFWYDEYLNKPRTYLPDFYLKDHSFFLDVKNPLKQEEDAYKISRVKLLIPLVVGDRSVITTFVERLAGIEPA